MCLGARISTHGGRALVTSILYSDWQVFGGILRTPGTNHSASLHCPEITAALTHPWLSPAHSAPSGLRKGFGHGSLVITRAQEWWAGEEDCSVQALLCLDSGCHSGELRYFEKGCLCPMSPPTTHLPFHPVFIACVSNNLLFVNLNVHTGVSIENRTHWCKRISIVVSKKSLCGDLRVTRMDGPCPSGYVT